MTNTCPRSGVNMVLTSRRSCKRDLPVQILLSANLLSKSLVAGPQTEAGLFLLLALMIKWQFEGGESGSALARKRGEQRAYAGDAVYDEMLGEAKLISRGSSNAFLQIESASSR